MGTSRIDLAWVDNSDNESGFKIERSADGVNFTQIALTSANAVSYSDLTVSANTLYYYRIRATNVIGDSNYSNTANATTPATTGPTDLYHFDEGANITVGDSAGSNGGSLIGSPLPQWIAPGYLGSAALSFSGNGAYNSTTSQSAVQLNSNLATLLGSTSTLDVWVKTTQVGNQTHWMAPAITGSEQSGGAYDINWGTIDATGRIGLYVGDSGGVYSTNPINDGQWHNIAMTRDASTGIIQIYVDGVLNGTGTSATGAETSQFSRIGELTDVANDGVTITGGNYFNGQLDELRLYNQVLVANDIASISRAPSAPTLQTATVATGPVAHLTFTNPSAYALNLEIDRKVGINGTYTALATLPASATMYDDTTVQVGTSYYYVVKAIDVAGASAASNALSVTPPVPTVVGRSIFYNNSIFDGQNGSSNLTDLNAIATDKQALRPGGTATFQNYTSYSKGITGIIVDIANEDELARPDDFEFKVGNDSNPAGWVVAPTQFLINSYPGRGPGGSTQITIIWHDNDIQNEWLQVTTLGAGHLAIGKDDVFYFGNFIGDTGDSSTDTLVTSNDANRVSSNQTGSASVTNPYDINRDGVVDSTDVGIVNAHLTGGGPSLQIISPGGTAPTVATPAGAVPNPVTGTTAALSVLGADAQGEAGLTYTWTTVGTPPAPYSLSVNGTNAAKNTTVTFTKAGTYNFQVTISDSAGLSATSSVSVQVNQVTTSVAVTPSASTLAANTSVALSATVLDQFGTPMAAQPAITWSVASGAGSVSSGGIYTAGRTAGAASVRATIVGGLFGTVNLTVFYEAVGWYQADATSGTTLADSSPNNFTATLTGAAAFATGVSGHALSLTGGNASLPNGIVGSLNDFTISAWVKASALANWARIFDIGNDTTTYMNLTADAGGTNALRFSITNSGGGNEQLIDGPALALNTWTHLAVTLSGNTATLYVNGVAYASNVAMTIHPTNLGGTTHNYLGKSQYNDPAFNGSIDDFRIYSRALSSQEVLALARPVIVVAANSPSQTNTTASLSVLASDITAGESALTYTWATTGTPPGAVSFSANGTNAAKNVTATFTKAGTYNFQVTADNPAAGATFATVSNLTFVVNSVATAVTVSPTTANLTSGQTRSFTASAVDQFNNSFAPSVIWSVDAGSVGTVNASGLYTAPLSPVGTATVRATSGSVSGTAAVTVSYLKGDINIDGHRDAADIFALMQALANLAPTKLLAIVCRTKICSPLPTSTATTM